VLFGQLFDLLLVTQKRDGGDFLRTTRGSVPSGKTTRRFFALALSFILVSAFMFSTHQG
jgi:hypothetical protein